MRIVALAPVLVFGCLASGFATGCCSAAQGMGPPAPIATDPSGPTGRWGDPLSSGDTVAFGGDAARAISPGAEEVPRSIRRAVSEQRLRVEDCVRLSAIVGDARVRQRARASAFALSSELAAIESSLDGADSDRLDTLVARLQRLSSEVDTLHERLEAAQ
jgi:hypothetical protein